MKAKVGSVREYWLTRDILRPLAKEASEVIVWTLAKIFAFSLAMGKVLVDWRLAHVVSLFKNSCMDKPGNYRLVSLTLVGAIK